MSDIAIRVENLGKQYLIGGPAERYLTLRESIVKSVKSIGIIFSGNGKYRSKNETIWALKDISFEVKRGEVIGIIGRNGAGKSTLLKILSCITEPTTGRAEVHGRVSSLLEVGTGFHPELTGRENIYLNGAILGMRHAEIVKKFDEIVAFSEVEKYLDTQIKHYSSGMSVRLAFAVAANLENEILLVDEVLAVGDFEFQKKCIGKMENVAKEGRTVLMVSHNMASIINLCQRAILLDSSRIVSDGISSEVVNKYLTNVRSEKGEAIWNNLIDAPGNEIVRLHSVRILQDGLDDATADVDISKDIFIHIEYWNLEEGSPLFSAIWLKHQFGTPVLASSNMKWVSLVDDPWYGCPHPKGLFRSICCIPGNFLNDGMYNITAIVGKVPNKTLILKEDAVSFFVHDTGEMRKSGFYGGWLGVIRPRLAWETKYIEHENDIQTFKS